MLTNSVDQVEAMSSPRCIKTHLPWDLLPAQINTVKPKVSYFESVELVFPLSNPLALKEKKFFNIILKTSKSQFFFDFVVKFIKLILDFQPMGGEAKITYFPSKLQKLEFFT